MAGADAVEQAEARGLIRLAEERDGIDVRFTHPLFGEAIRRRLGIAAARRVRGELARALQRQPITAPTQRMRLAELTLDSDVVPDVDLLVGAARDAIALSNIALGERLSRAAVNRGAGLRGSELLGRALLWQGNAAEAEDVFSAFDPDQLGEIDLVRWGTARIANLHWAMGDADAADEVINLLRSRVADPMLGLVVDGLAAASLVFENRLVEAADLAGRVLADPAAPPSAVQWAVFGGGLALGLMGRGNEVAAIAERGRALDDQAEGLLRYLMAFGEIRALVATGDFAVAEQRSADIVRVFLPRPVSGVGNGQRAGRHRGVGARTVSRDRVANGADGCGSDL